VKDHGALERAPLLEGKSMHITIASTHKPKQREPVAGERSPAAKAEAGEDEGAAPAVAIDAAGPVPAITGE
jgi:hypothetical protein